MISLVFMLSSTTGCAYNDNVINYQGYLRENGVPVNGLKTIVFAFYDGPEGQNLLSTATRELVITNGLLTATIPITQGLFTLGGPYYLELEVDGTVLTPRVQVTPVPRAHYAHNAGSANTVQGIPWSSQIPTTGQVPVFDGEKWVPSIFFLPWNAQNGGIGYVGGTVKVRTPAESGGQTYSLFAQSDLTTGETAALYGQNHSIAGRGVYGHVLSTTGTTYGLYGRSDSIEGKGVFGTNTATTGITFGGRFETNSFNGRGVSGFAGTTVGSNFGVHGQSNSMTGIGVYGIGAATSGTNYGVYGQSSSNTGRGVQGLNNVTTGINYGVYGVSASTEGRGTLGFSTATSGTTYGVFGQSNSNTGIGTLGFAVATTGSPVGVWGLTQSTSSSSYGVRGTATSPAFAIYAVGSYGASGTKSFRIDHPFNPETHYLLHYSMEAPEPINVYRGSVTLNSKGESWVELPRYFGEINRDPSYQLTPIGAAMPNLHIASKITNNRFKIAGGVPGKEVSWIVKAVRNDLYVRQYGAPVETEKDEYERGKYQHPELYGQPAEKGIDYRIKPEQPNPQERL